MRVQIFYWSFTAALAGFLFGFDTIVIPGPKKTIQSLWHLRPGLHGAMSKDIPLEPIQKKFTVA